MEQMVLNNLIELLKPHQVIINPTELIVYETDATYGSGKPDAVFLPNSTEEVSKVVKWVAERRMPIIARGAGTGLSGGAIAENGGIVLAFSHMRDLLDVDQIGFNAIVEPGMVNQDLGDLLLKQGLYYPPDPASGRSCTIGGNIGENAGGPHCFKYGVTTNYILGYEFVQADGRVLKVGGYARDYPEYNLVSLLTGSEGTLGVVTKIYTRLLNPPPAVKTTMVAFDSVEQAGQAVSAMIAEGLVPAAMEMLDQKIARIIEDYAHPGIPTDAGAILILEVDGYPDSLDMQVDKIAEILEHTGSKEFRIADSAEQREQIWFARKSAIGALARLAPAYLLLDGTVERSKLSQILEATNRICNDLELQVGYVFHAGDGNLHPLILMYPDDDMQVKRVHEAGRLFMQEVVKLGGSITGEHGIGTEKREYLPLMYSPQELGIMMDVKAVFDPNKILNPGKIFLENAAEQLPEISEKTKISIPEHSFAPHSAEEAAAIFGLLSKNQRHVRISCNEDRVVAPTHQEVICGTQNLSGIVNYAAEDLYITVGSGTLLKDAQSYLQTRGRKLALAAPGEEATVGGIVATNLNAPLRMRYGSISDQILTMTIALADGRLIRAGRPVVKNVAGYDLPRLMVGSFGSLGLIVDITFKVHTRPNYRRTIVLPVDDLKRGIDLGHRCLRFTQVASGITLSNAIRLKEFPESEFLFAYSAEGLAEDVIAELELVEELLENQGFQDWKVVETTCGTDLWCEHLGYPNERTFARVGLPAKHLADYLKKQESVLENEQFFIDIANGLLYPTCLSLDVVEVDKWLHAIRGLALDMNGYAIILSAPETVIRNLDPWGYRPDTLHLMQALKEKLDPAGILDNGLFQFT